MRLIWIWNLRPSKHGRRVRLIDGLFTYIYTVYSSEDPMKFRYTGIRVKNVKQSVKFYTTTMGMQEVDRGQMQAGGIYVHLTSPESDQDLELNYYPPGTPYCEEYVEGSELDHLAFWSAIAPWSENGYTLAFIRDPNGIWIELMGKTR
jgi:catechol 2,3-dioxygenase-like lactoylglutathione lyase family enzyme